MEQLEKSEDEFHSGMNKVFKSMENISSCIFFSCILVLLLVLASILAQLVNNSKKLIGPLLAHPALITRQSRSIDTLPREMSKMKIKGKNKAREFMKRTTIVLISTSSDIYIYHFTLQVILAVSMFLLLQNI